jgi:hypothetical protein
VEKCGGKRRGRQKKEGYQKRKSGPASGEKFGSEVGFGPCVIGNVTCTSPWRSLHTVCSLLCTTSTKYYYTMLTEYVMLQLSSNLDEFRDMFRFRNVGGSPV